MEQERDEEYEALRPEMSRRRKVAVVVLGVLIVFVLLAGLVSFWAYRQLFPSGRPGAEIVLDIPTGSSTSSIADLLEKKSVINNAFLFKLYVKAKSAGPFQAGTYRMPLHNTASDVLRRLKAGPLPPPTRQFTVQPGLNLRQVPQRIVESIPTFSVEKLNAVLAAGQVRSQFQPADKPLEGFLFPDTYQIGEGADETAAIQAMVTQFDKVATELGLADSESLVGHTPYEVLIVASLVEEEAKVDVDRAKIAQVIYNRLTKGMALGVDATLCYLHDERPCVLHQSDLDRADPYNSRRNTGLPPTPIASVSRKAIEAALHPDGSNALFYVLDPNLPAGQHFFTASASEFEAAKARCRAAGLGCD
ncbi:MAG: hypothetical protein QOI95_2682 [Acidimicrobiaceae bacterium]|jgi:UPF0755 protein